MKAGFSLTKRYAPQFAGNKQLAAEQQLIATLKMPEVNDLFAILDRLQDAGFKQGNEGDLSLAQATQIAKEAGQYLPKYVTLENAEDFTIKDVISFPPYFGLAVELLFALVNFAQPTETDQKNSERLPA